MKSLLALSVLLFVFPLFFHLHAEDTKIPEQDSVIAKVLGKDITFSQKDLLRGIILRSLFDAYAKENHISPTPDEINTFVIKTQELNQKEYLRREREREKILKQVDDESLSESDKAELRSKLEMYERIINSNLRVAAYIKENSGMDRTRWERPAKQFIQAWKVNLALYEEYGGRVIYQQGGPEPLDAYLEFLLKSQEAGDFQIIDKKCESLFWNYFTNEKIHVFSPKENANNLMKIPWWTKKLPDESQEFMGKKQK